MADQTVSSIGESLAPIVLDLPPQPWTSAQILQILARAEQAGYERAKLEVINTNLRTDEQRTVAGIFGVKQAS